MRVLVRHGHFAFYPRKTSELSRFAKMFDVDLVRDGDFFTFDFLAGAERYSLAGKLYLNLPALETYEGRGPWDVLKQNDFVYSTALGLLVPKASITAVMQSPRSDTYFICPTPILQPGTLDATGQQILSYDAIFNDDTFQLKIIEVAYE